MANQIYIFERSTGANWPYSKAVLAGNNAYVSGNIALDS